MVLKTECRCIDPSLRKVLDKAISNLEKESVGTRTDDYAKKLEQINIKINELRALGVSEDILETARATVKKDPVIKQFDDLKQWLDECECPSDMAFDWTAFPYHEVGYKVPVVRTGKVGEACTISLTEKQALDTRLTELANKYVYSVRDPVFLVFMKNKYGEKEITASNVRSEVVKKGLMTESEMNEFNRIASELDKACGRQSGKTRNIHDTRLLHERHGVGLITEKREKYFEKRK